jgi:hypothetical protein
MCLSTSRQSSEPVLAISMKGQVVEYEEVSNKGKMSAENRKVNADCYLVLAGARLAPVDAR